MGKRVEARTAESAKIDPVRVRRWRRDQFYDLGFTLAESRKLAEAPVDVGAARRLIRSGCPKRMALRILL
jgi:hypothetical protein